jgi:hypothetical protein
MLSFFLVFLLTGCNYRVITDYPPVVIWSDKIYFLTADKVSEDLLGRQLGTVRKQIHTFPKQNEESNILVQGSRIYEIKGTDPLNEIVVEDKGEYFKARARND